MSAKADWRAPRERSIWIGFDPREAAAFAVARETCQFSVNGSCRTYGVVLDDLRRLGLYTRPTERRDGRLWDVISEAPMATEFAISRFLVPYLAGSGWALFMDCDMLVTGDVAEFDGYASMFNHYGRAVRVVKHEYVPKGERKFLGQAQTQYGRKNWSSVMLFNCAHAACRKLTLEYVENAPGLELHQFKWCDDLDIGALPEGWNYLVGEQNQCERDQIRNLHYTQGTPCFPEYASCEFAEVWHREREKMLAAG